MASHYIALVVEADAQTSVMDGNGTAGVVTGTSSDTTAVFELRVLDGVVNGNSVPMSPSIIVQAIEKIKDYYIQNPTVLPY
jgi:hypothetical protein